MVNASERDKYFQKCLLNCPGIVKSGAMMRAKKILSSFAAAALSMTAFAHCAHNATGIGSFFVEEAPQAFVYSAQQEKEDNRYPWLVCLPNQDNFAKVTSIAPPGPQLDALLKEFPDSKVVATLPKREILFLGRTGSGPSAELLEHALRIVTPKNKAALTSCIGGYQGYLDGMGYYKLNPLPLWPMDNNPITSGEPSRVTMPKNGNTLTNSGPAQS